MKLHAFGGRESTVDVSSLTILAFSCFDPRKTKPKLQSIKEHIKQTSSITNHESHL
jgi:hypothetical protein